MGSVRSSHHVEVYEKVKTINVTCWPTNINRKADDTRNVQQKGGRKRFLKPVA
jgi:hypothetical protein